MSNNDLISREALREEMQKADIKATDYETLAKMYEKCVDNAPTVATQNQKLGCEICVNRNIKSQKACTSPFGVCEFFNTPPDHSLEIAQKSIELGRRLGRTEERVESSGYSAGLKDAERPKADILEQIIAEINSSNRGTCDYYIVDRIEEIINEYQKSGNK